MLGRIFLIVVVLLLTIVSVKSFKDGNVVTGRIAALTAGVAGLSLWIGGPYQGSTSKTGQFFGPSQKSRIGTGQNRSNSAVSQYPLV